MIIIYESLETALAMGDDIAVHSRFYGAVVDSIMTVADLSQVTGDVWETWVFNGKTFEPSVYSGFTFNSYVADEGITYGAKEEGIFVLSGNTDAGEVIHDGVILSPSIFGLLNKKRFRQGFLEITGTAPIVRAEVGGASVSLPVMRSKVMFPRALVGQKWTFLVAEFDELGKVELFPVILTR